MAFNSLTFIQQRLGKAAANLRQTTGRPETFSGAVRRECTGCPCRAARDAHPVQHDMGIPYTLLSPPTETGKGSMESCRLLRQVIAVLTDGGDFPFLINIR